MWTEILNEEVGVVHVGVDDDYHVVFTIGDAPRDSVRAAMQTIHERETKRYVEEQTRELAEELDQQRRMNERLEKAGYDRFPTYEELRRGNVS